MRSAALLFSWSSGILHIFLWMKLTEENAETPIIYIILDWEIQQSFPFLVKGKSAVVWRKVILVIFVIFELGPDLESLCNALSSESISCGIRAFFHPKNCLRSFGPKK